ncbi:MAG: leucyl/phenylalanyl-tRNA--protein transferase [Alphaproteobacteria bacterium]|nr:leucyl/phenylalanyl-tRNA--protein transferase [Alphaproteobacteria bacterium]
MQLILTPELVLEAYRQGLFPMAYNGGSPYIHWICPEMRGQLSIENLHIPRRLKKTLLQHPYKITVNKAFESVIHGCAQPGEKRPETWINASILKVFVELHGRSHAHSLECWKGRELAGGIYGLAIGGAFFGESMFSTKTDASKIALVHMTARLWKGGFTLFDTQFVNEHLKQFGVYELPHAEYKKALNAALERNADFHLARLKPEKILEEYLAR